jgi:hypothetical protein
MRPLKDILDPSKGANAVRGGHRLSTRRRKPLKATTTQPLDRLTLMSAPATGSEIAQLSNVGFGSPTVSRADPVLGGCLIPFVPSEATTPTVDFFKYEGSVVDVGTSEEPSGAVSADSEEPSGGWFSPEADQAFALLQP